MGSVRAGGCPEGRRALREKKIKKSGDSPQISARDERAEAEQPQVRPFPSSAPHKWVNVGAPFHLRTSETFSPSALMSIHP